MESPSVELFYETPDAVLAIAADDTVLYWNRAAERIFGCSRSEAAGNKVSDLIIPSDLIQGERLIRDELLSRDVSVYQSMRSRKDGSMVSVTVSSRAVKDVPPAIPRIDSKRHYATQSVA